MSWPGVGFDSTSACSLSNAKSASIAALKGRKYKIILIVGKSLLTPPVCGRACRHINEWSHGQQTSMCLVVLMPHVGSRHLHRLDFFVDNKTKARRRPVTLTFLDSFPFAANLNMMLDLSIFNCFSSITKKYFLFDLIEEIPKPWLKLTLLNY